MKSWSWAVILSLAAIACGREPTATPLPVVVMETNLGTIEIELEEKLAPISVKNFLEYVNAGFYDGLVFHRVIDNFMIQGGGMEESLRMKQPRAPIRNEANNGLHNTRGTIAMARTSAVDSAQSQFFINLKDNTHLDHRPGNPATFGYAVFGRVTAGMDVVDRIAKVQVGSRTVDGIPSENVPRETIKIISLRLKK